MSPFAGLRRHAQLHPRPVAPVKTYSRTTLISHTGRNRKLLASVALAKQSGAAVIAITAPRSPLAELSSLALTVSIPEDTDVYTPMFSRLMHPVVIDILAVGLARRGGEPTRLRLRRIKQALYAKYMPKEL